MSAGWGSCWRSIRFKGQAGVEPEGAAGHRDEVEVGGVVFQPLQGDGWRGWM